MSNQQNFPNIVVIIADDIMFNLKTNDGDIISMSGNFTNYAIFERGYYISGRIGKLIPVLSPNKNSGIVVMGSMDEFSDIDLVLVIDPPTIDDVMHERTMIASRLGRLVAAFTGEHVGEPRLLICLYDDPVLHVDFKFVNLRIQIQLNLFLLVQ